MLALLLHQLHLECSADDPKAEVQLGASNDYGSGCISGGRHGGRVEQAHKTFPGYGQGVEGYAKRYGATYADTMVSRMLGTAIFPVILHQDRRYFAAAGLSNVYRASADAAENLLREFLSRKVTRNVPAFANGKP